METVTNWKSWTAQDIQVGAKADKMKQFLKRALGVNQQALGRWRTSDPVYPMPSYGKQTIVLAFALMYDLKTLVETGTYKGDMVAAMQPHFRTIHSIELYPPLYEAAVKRFKNAPNVILHHGDSGKIIEQIQVTEPALFWLDGHYSGEGTGKGEKECPALEEVKVIAKSDLPHVVLIDDARSFEQASYPDIEELEAIAGTKFERCADMLIWRKF